MRHLENVIIQPQTFTTEGVLFDIPMRARPGKPIVCMVPAETEKNGILLPEVVQAKYQPDYAVVYDPAGCDGLNRGDLVAVKPYTGAWYTDKDFDFVPKGRMFKILGNVDDWDDNVLYKVDL